MARIVGIDYGQKRIGLARTDIGGLMASPWTVLLASKDALKKVEEVLKKIEEIECELIVVGLPLMMSGQDSDMTREVRSFAKLLEEKSEIRVRLWDERLTSAQSNAMMKEVGMKRKERDKKSDLMAATLILQSYLDAHLV